MMTEKQQWFSKFYTAVVGVVLFPGADISRGFRSVFADPGVQVSTLPAAPCTSNIWPSTQTDNHVTVVTPWISPTEGV